MLNISGASCLIPERQVSSDFPSTPFWDIALRRGKVSNNMDWNLLSHHNVDDPLLLDEHISREDFKKVFLKGKKKLRILKVRLIKNFILGNPLTAITMVAKEPVYYTARLIRQVLRQ